ncbi:MAG: matrixin family metalloprotease [Ignavibacterium sp.]|nr:MAG: matrixin family metalloprotease [Ignavibacterium sp.]
MIKFKTILYITFLISFQTITISNLIFAQNRSIHKKPESTSTRKHNVNDRSSESSFSDASKIGFEQIRDRENLNKEINNRNRNNRKTDFYNNHKGSFKKKTRNNQRETKNSNKKKITDNYFHIDRSGRTLWDGKHWNLSSFPLKIFVKESSSPYYKTLYKAYVNYALNVWKIADSRINYSFVNSKSTADISVIFIEDLGDKYNEDYIGLTEYNIDRSKIIDYSKIQISLTKFDDEIVSDGEIKATIIHELGHAFGLGHSKNEFDIMYPYIDPEHSPLMHYNELSGGDCEAIEDAIDLGRKEQYVQG